ncbi:MAG: DUF6056 family protein [Lachnospiraceae bacterium]|nr:DUF6056 family protein [Lachnospiraceae bacterium]
MNRLAASFSKRIQKILTPKHLALFLFFLYLFSLIPLLMIGHYNYPSADDFSEALEAHRTWVSTHSLIGTFLTAVKRAAGDWLHWMGYYTCNLLMAFSPTVFGGRIYVITSYLMLGMLSLSTAYFLHAVFVKIFRMDRWISLCITMATLLVTVECMPGAVEAFYWYLGAVNYTFIHGITLFYFALLIGCVFDPERKRKGKIIGASILGFLVGGGNQMSALNAAILVIFTLILLSVLKKKKERKLILIPSITFLVGFLLNVASPGNLVRAEGASGMNPVKAIFVSFYECLDLCLNEWTTWPVLLLLLALIPLFYKALEHTDFTFPCPLLVAAGGFCLVSAMATPPLFALGNFEAGRLRSLMFTMYILVLVLVAGYVTGWVRKKMTPVSQTRTRRKDLFSPSAALFLFVILLFYPFAALITSIPEPGFFTTDAAVNDLQNGSAKAYADALAERTALYESGEKDIVVKPLPEEPLLLYFSDITYEEEDWQRDAICRFYGLSSLKKEGGTQ